MSTSNHVFCESDGYVLHEAVHKLTLKVWYKCANCGHTLNEDSPHAARVIAGADLITAPVVHPSKMRKQKG